MPLPKHAYCESEIDEDLVASSQAGPDETSSSSTTRPRNTTKRTTGTNSDSAQSTKTHDTSGSTLSRNSTSKTSVSSRNASADRASKNPKSTNADTRRQKGTPSTSAGGAKKSPEAIPSTAGHHSSRPTMIGNVRPPNAVETIGGYLVPDSSPISISPTTTFAPSSYHAPPSAPPARPRSGSASRSRPSSGHWETPDGIWLPPGEPALSAHPAQIHAHSTPQIPSQYHTPRAAAGSQVVSSGRWVRDDTVLAGAYSGAAQPRSRPPLQHQAGAQLDGRRASMYGAPIIQHYQASPVHHDPARAMMPPPQSLPVRTSSTRQTPTGTNYSAPGFDPHQTIRPPRTSSIQQRPNVIPTQTKAKSTSYYTKTSGALATSTTTGRRGAENTTSRKARDKTDKHTQSAQEYQDRMDSRATKTSEELMAEALEERRRSKKDRTVASEPTPKSRSGNISQSRHSRAGSSISRTGTDMDRPMQITMDGNNVGISGETGDRSIEIGTAEDGTMKVTVGSPTKRKEQSYHGGSSSHSRLSFADRARRRDSGLSAVDAQNED